jgi:hypothetical protein
MENEIYSILGRKNAIKICTSEPDDDLHSVVAFFHGVKWSGLAITHEINRVPEENTISYSTVGKCVRMFVLSMNETDTPIVPNRKMISVLTTASPLRSQRSHLFQFAKLPRKR